MAKEKSFPFLAPLVVVIVLIILGISLFFAFQKSKDFSLNQNKNPNQDNNQQTACTEEAKICPDGSAVGRTGANCEFAECPTIENKEKLCTDSGGKTTNIDCYCPGTQDFYNTCAIGGCSCTPDPTFKRQIKTCDCGQDNCFDGSKCVKITNN